MNTMTKYKAIVTTAGAAKIAAASAGGKQLKIAKMAVGDGNGNLPTPNPAQTKLVNEKYRAALNGLNTDHSLKNHIIAELIIPASVGGFWLREMGLYDDAGTLIAVSNMAESYKPKLEEGSGRTQTLRMVLIVSSTEAIQIIAGGDTVLATKDFVADAIADHEKTRNHPDASTTAKGLVQLSSATTSTDETKAVTPKALKVVNDAGLKKAANLAELTDKATARRNLALGDAATKNVGTESGQLMAVGAFGLGVGSIHHDDAYNNRGEIFRVNSASKNAPGNGAYGVVSLPVDGTPSAGYLAVSNGGAGYLGSSIASKVVKWSRIYSTDNKPSAADVGAWSQAEADGRYLQLTGGIVKKLAIQPGDTSSDNIDLRIESAAHTPLLLNRQNANANVSMGFQLSGKPVMRFGVAADNELHFGTEANQTTNPRIYTTAKPPTAAETGALTDVQAVQKYALRSIKINGKPLSADVNLLAGDVNAWNKTEADSRYLKKSGDIMAGALVLKSTITAGYYGSTPNVYPVGSGAYIGQFNSKAPFYQPDFNWEVGSGGHYVPLVKGRATRKGKGWPTAVSYGYLLPGKDEHAHPVIHAQGDGGVECIWDFSPTTGKISSKAGEFTPLNETLNAIYPIGIVVLFANATNPNTAFPGQKWDDLSAKGYDSRVLSLGYTPLATGGSNKVTVNAHNLPDHSHRGGMEAPGVEWGTANAGTDNTGTYKRGVTSHTYTDANSMEFVRNAPLDVTNAYVNMRGWMRVA
ncbi:TPA: phage tail protein [Serratia odorifera]